MVVRIQYTVFISIHLRSDDEPATIKILRFHPFIPRNDPLREI